MSQNGHVLSISHLHHSYEGRGAVLDIPSFSLERGEMLFLHGPSGSGKTTLLSLLTGVLSIQKGHVKILGHALEQMSAGKRDALRAEHMGYIFQVFNLLPFLNVLENILLPVQMNKQRAAKFQSIAAAREQARMLAEKLGIAHLLDARAGELSVGQQQRVAAARALIGSPELIVADEPTSALDSDLREVFLKTLFEQARSQKTSVLFVSHDRSLASLFDRSVGLAEINKAMQLAGV
ncbi:ABC transporter ATP-binding protein [bacterium]|nr:ABC transporter ATP-binding protein [bacterium]